MHEAIIEINERGFGKITIDGNSIAARKLIYECEAGKPAKLTIELAPIKTTLKSTTEVIYTEGN